MLSSYAEKIHEPLQHTVLIQADPAGRPSAVGTLSPSDCYPVGPAGPYVAGGSVGPDVCFTNPEPVTHTVLVHADPAGQDASAVGTPSPSPSTFVPCLEHICAGGGGGSVANMGLRLYIGGDFILRLRIVLLVGMLWVDVMCDMG